MFDRGHKVVLCHGCFDMLHYGHLLHFIEAKKYGGEHAYLVVSITADAYFPKIKGKNRPYFNEQQRCEMLANLRIVDEVHICRESTGTSAIRAYRPNYYAKGIDYISKGINEQEAATCAMVGAKVVFTGSPKFSSGDLIRRL